MKLFVFVATFLTMISGTAAQDLDAVYICGTPGLPPDAVDFCNSIEARIDGQVIEGCTCSVSFVTLMMNEAKAESWCINCQGDGLIAIPQFGYSGGNRQLRAGSMFGVKFTPQEEKMRNQVSIIIPKELFASPGSKEKMVAALENSTTKLSFDGCACSMDFGADMATCVSSPQCESRFALTS